MKRMTAILAWTALAAFLANGMAATARADDPAAPQAPGVADDDKSLTARQKADLAGKLAPSLVKVEYTFRQDKGDEPASGGRFIVEERPYETAGFVLAPDQVLSEELDEHPRFIQSVRVRCGDQVVEARITARFKDKEAVLLTTAQPLKAKPLAFDAKLAGPLYAVAYGLREDEWTVMVGRYAQGAVYATETGRTYTGSPVGAVLVDSEGKAAGFVPGSSLPIDDTWKGSPLAWAKYGEAEVEGMCAKARGLSDQAVLRVALSFRSPRKEEARRLSPRDEETKTEQNVLGVLVNDTTVVVLAALKPKVTARLQRVRVCPAAGAPVEATFAGTLRDYGCFVAKLANPLPGKATLAAGPIRSLRNQMLLKAEVHLQEERRVAYVSPARIEAFALGWKRMVYPQLRGEEERMFLFTPGGELAAFPVHVRPKVSTDDNNGRSNAYVMPAERWPAILADLPKQLDTCNVPLTEEQENRLAWLGVELQPLSPELARANGVSDLTRDGRFGAIVSHVYPGSPADKQGVQVGSILLQLLVEGEPKPVEVEAEDNSNGGPFPWAKWDELEEQYFDQIRTPWPPAENVLTRKLTDLGFGRKFKAEFFQDGKKSTKDFEVTASPAYYGTAPRCKSDKLGLTVREMTYELRRYYRTEEAEPGVVVSKVEPGSKASVAGVKPYEIITHVNDQPVKTVAGLQGLFDADKGELKLTIKRMTVGTRQVKIDLAAPAPATRPARPAKGPEGGPRGDDE